MQFATLRGEGASGWHGLGGGEHLGTLTGLGGEHLGVMTGLGGEHLGVLTGFGGEHFGD